MLSLFSLSSWTGDWRSAKEDPVQAPAALSHIETFRDGVQARQGWITLHRIASKHVKVAYAGIIAAHKGKGV
jgi:hypothetical protein